LNSVMVYDPTVDLTEPTAAGLTTIEIEWLLIEAEIALTPRSGC
jgi:hypothetical protein